MVRWLGYGGAALGLGLLPLSLNSYLVNLLVLIGIYGIVAIGLGLLWGKAGQISMANAALFGVGAYTSALLTTATGLGFWSALPLATGMAALMGGVVGMIAIRLRHAYLAMATLAFGVIFDTVSNEWMQVTGGGAGLGGIPPPTLFGLVVDNEARYFYLVWGWVGLSLLFSHNLVSSRVGQALQAMGENAEAAAVLGIHVNLTKLKIFTLSAAYAGLAGALFAHHQRFIAPSSFSVQFGVMLLAMVLIGGKESPLGALLGVALLTYLPEFLNAVANWGRLPAAMKGALSEYSTLLVLNGLIMLLVIHYLPGGLVGLYRDRLSSFVSPTGLGTKRD